MTLSHLEGDEGGSCVIIWKETVAGRRDGSARLIPDVFRRQPGEHAATGSEQQGLQYKRRSRGKLVEDTGAHLVGHCVRVLTYTEGNGEPVKGLIRGLT